jgi:AraC-like DNA-binding protein
LEEDFSYETAALGVEVFTQPAAGVASHMHPGMELGICVRGTNTRHFRDHSFRVAPGQVWLAGAWEPHAWESRRETHKVTVFFLPSVLWDPVDPNPTWLHMFAVPARNRPQVRSRENRQQVLGIAGEIAGEHQERRRGWRRACRLALMRVLMILEREWGSRSAGVSTVRPDYLSRISPALELLRLRQRRRVPVAEAAARCGLSPSRFQDIFRRTLGVPYGRFSLRARLGHAAEQLLSTDRTLDHIAENSGFTDARHLRRMFRGEYGCTPSEYRLRPQASMLIPGRLSQRAD